MKRIGYLALIAILVLVTLSLTGCKSDCEDCDGTGVCHYCEGSLICFRCNGMGGTYGDICYWCNGAGLCNECRITGQCKTCHGTGEN